MTSGEIPPLTQSNLTRSLDGLILAVTARWITIRFELPVDFFSVPKGLAVKVHRREKISPHGPIFSSSPLDARNLSIAGVGMKVMTAPQKMVYFMGRDGLWAF